MDALGRYSISLDVHTKTKVGPLVNLVKKEGNEQISKKAKNLLNTWKKSTQASTSNPEPKIPENISSTDKSLKNIDGHDNGDIHLKSLPESRLKMYEKLKSVFEMSSSQNVVAAIAFNVENAINTTYPFLTDNKNYLLKARDYIFNLKKNEVSLN